ncbi:hypothetical protein KI387_044534, partial [Taxus chinensis]
STSKVSPEDIPHASTSSSRASTSKVSPEVTFSHKGLGEYTLDNAFLVGKLPLSPCNYGHPNAPHLQEPPAYYLRKNLWRRYGYLEDEHIPISNNSWLYDDRMAECYESTDYTKGHKMMKNMNWKGRGLGPQGH